MRLTEAEYEALIARRSAERVPGNGYVATAPRKPLTGRFVLPWPPTGLSPNARLHWAALSKLKKQYREACRLEVLRSLTFPSEGLYVQWKGPLRLHLDFVPPDRRKRDWDNLVASMKAGLDGLADALQVDDSQFVLSFHVVPDQVAGLVRVSVEPA